MLCNGARYDSKGSVFQLPPGLRVTGSAPGTSLIHGFRFWLPAHHGSRFCLLSTKRNTHFPGSSIFQQTIEPPRDGSSPKLPTSKWAGRRLRHGLESSHRIGYMTGKENLCFSSHIKGRLRPKNCASRERRDFPRKGLGIDLSDPG
jgi:hypothetical protein